VTKTTYRLIEIFSEGPGEEQEFTTEGAAQAALKQAVADLVAEGFTLVRQSDHTARLQIRDPGECEGEGPLVSVRFFIEAVTPLRTVDATDWSKDQLMAFLDGHCPQGVDLGDWENTYGPAGLDPSDR
jgi:hypothetical protein